MGVSFDRPTGGFSRRRSAWSRTATGFSCLLRAVTTALLVVYGGQATAAEFAANGYSFSDELGDFRILGVSGTGSKADPFVVDEELFGIGPVILVIRRLSAGSKTNDVTGGTLATFHLVKRVHNRSRGIWIGFDMELQEIRNRPSIYGDGLSFGQSTRKANTIRSDRFARTVRRYEPYDQLSFEAGHVDPDEIALFRLHITDLTPVSEFFLMQNPQTLYASRRRRRAAVDRSARSGLAEMRRRACGLCGYSRPVTN